jgi:hypothetical protein
VSLSLYMDEHVPSAITAALRRRGVDVLTVQEDGRRELADPLVMDRATELHRLLFSQDQDMLRHAHERQDARQQFSGVVYAKQGRVTIGQCIRDLELICTDGTPDEFANGVEYLPFL